jgi:hypothetical protein
VGKRRTDTYPFVKHATAGSPQIRSRTAENTDGWAVLETAAGRLQRARHADRGTRITECPPSRSVWVHACGCVAGRWWRGFASRPER